jgi:hypothetical protein
LQNREKVGYITAISTSNSSLSAISVDCHHYNELLEIFSNKISHFKNIVKVLYGE